MISLILLKLQELKKLIVSGLTNLRILFLKKLKFSKLRKLESTISRKISETNSSFRVKQCITGKAGKVFLLFLDFFSSINRIFILAGRMGTRLLFF